MEWVVGILQWILPAGIGGVTGLLIDRRILNARALKQKDSIYLEMYNGLRESVDILQKENNELWKKQHQLELLVRKASKCKFFDFCPMHDELVLRQKDDKYDGAKGQRQGNDNEENNVSQRASRDGCADDSGQEPDGYGVQDAGTGGVRAAERTGDGDIKRNKRHGRSSRRL
jgi:hypothetical protein